MRKAIETSQKTSQQAEMFNQSHRISSRTELVKPPQAGPLMLEVWQDLWRDYKKSLFTTRLGPITLLTFLMFIIVGFNFFGALGITALCTAVGFVEAFIIGYSKHKCDAEIAYQKAKEDEIRLQKRIARQLQEQQEREARDKQFFELSETTCNRCGRTVRAHKRILDVAHYTCDYCRKSFTVRLYNPDRIK